MTRRRLLLAALLLLSAGRAWAAPATALLESSSARGAADCPDAESLARTVNDGLGRAALTPAGAAAHAAPLRVAVAFERAGKGYAATVHVGDGRGGTRRLSDAGPGCGPLANAVGVLLVVVLDSSAEALGGEAAPAPSAARSASALASTPSSPASRPATTADVGLGAGVAQGLVGGWSPAVGLAGTLAYHRWAARVGGLWLPTKASDFGPGRVEVGLAIARLALCWSPVGDPSRVMLGLCAQQQVGWMRGRGLDFDGGNRAADHLWLAAGASLVASGPAGRALGWEVEAGVVRLLQEQRFVVDNLGTAFQSDPFAFMTTLALTTRIW